MTLSDGYFVAKRPLPVGDEITITHGENSRRAIVVYVVTNKNETIVHFNWI